MAWSARPTSTNKLTQLVHQAAHGFHIGQPVIFNGTWVLAQADSLVDCAGTWIVVNVPDVNSFFVTQEGWLNNLNPADFNGGVITPGIQYYLSPLVAGKFTSVQPVITGTVNLPCLVCDTATSGYFYGGSGLSIVSGDVFQWQTVTVDTIMAANLGYFINSPGNINMTLPEFFNEGDIMSLALVNTGTFTILQRDAPIQQRIITLGGETSLGAAGNILSVDLHMRVDLTGYIANTILHCDSDGSIDVT